MIKPTALGSRDARLQDSIEAALDGTPGVNAAAIGVAVVDECVQLSGRASSFPERRRVIDAVAHVAGVRSIADDIVVDDFLDADRTDDVARASAVRLTLASDARVPDTVAATVRGHMVELTGAVAGPKEREAAIADVRTVLGVASVIDRTTLTIPDRLDELDL